MTDPTDPIETRNVWAEPYDARQCPECETWVYTAAGPFAEGDRTKTMADWLHWERFHLEEHPTPATAIGFPFFDYNDTPVEAVLESHPASPTRRETPTDPGNGALIDRLDHLQQRPRPEPPSIGD